VLRWALAFAFTEIVEVPIYQRILGAGLAEAFGASALTHPALYFVFVPLARGRLSYVQYAILGEALVVLIEAAYFALLFRRGVARSLVASLIANGASYGLGLLAHRLFGWP
jgi:hypothetical protein